MKILFFSIVIGCSCGDLYAKSLGVVGDVFPVAETSFLVLIEERLTALKASGELAALDKRWVQTTASHANRPVALGLNRTEYTMKHHYVPEIRLSQDVLDARGHVLYPKGMLVNALEQMPSYNPCWLFFNADDEAQLNWAKQQKKDCPTPKYILTGGAIHTSETRLNAMIYFDQAGKITKKLHITHVPTKVTREQNHLVIHECAIRENGDAL
jgi:conjugal transfer pilus assembly protein TraW